MTKKILRGLIENGNLTDFSVKFQEAINTRVAELKEELRLDIANDYKLSEGADLIGDEKEIKKIDKKDNNKGPSDEPDADDDDESDLKVNKKHLKENIKGMEGPYMSPKKIKYYYDPKQDMFFDPSTDLYVTGKTLGIK